MVGGLLMRYLGVFCVLLFTSTACTTTQIDPSIQYAANTYYFQSLTSSKSSNFVQGLSLDAKERAAELGQIFIEESEVKLAALFSERLKGTNPAEVHVLFSNIKMASAAGRALFQSDSSVTGTVTISDPETGNIIAAHTIQAVDASLKGDGNIGFLVAIAVNTVISTPTQRVGRLGDKFVQEVALWLSQAG